MIARDGICPKTLLQSFTDPTESKIVERTYLIYRLRLPYVLASSLLYFVSEGYPLDYLFHCLCYYSESTTQSQPTGTRDIALQRVSSYIQLLAVGASTSSMSSSSLFNASAGTVGKDQIMVHNLGVLLYEV
jgi:hypothetical protein